MKKTLSLMIVVFVSLGAFAQEKKSAAAPLGKATTTQGTSARETPAQQKQREFAAKNPQYAKEITDMRKRQDAATKKVNP